MIALTALYSAPRALSVCLLGSLLWLAACAVPVTPPAAAPAAPTVPSAAEEAALFPLTITDAIGQEFTFDAPPKIGCMFYGCYETLADLGVTPQASLAGNPADRGANFYTPGPEPVHLIEDFQNPELWAAAEVELIVVSAPADPANDALAQAAPLFHLYYMAGDSDAPVGLAAFRKNLELLGQVTGQPAAAAAAIARYEQAVTKLRSLATPETAALQVALLRSREGYQIYGDDNAFCTVIADAGLGHCLSEGDFVNEISPEELLALDPDWIIYFPRGDSYKDRTDPVWLELSAVKEGRVYNAVSNRHGCCSVRGLYQPLIEYVNHILPEAGAPELLSTADFDPEHNWLVQPE